MLRRTLLVVDDDADLRGLFRTTLTLAGFDVYEAADGLEALRRLDTLLPDLIVLDLMMPGFSGIAVLQELAAQAHTRSIPIMVVTASAENLDYLDVSCVLRKPVMPDELVRAAQRCLASAAPPASS